MLVIGYSELVDGSLKEGQLLERVLGRLMRKHISGTTMSSALEKAKQLNGEGISASITFLSDRAHDKMKARYATTTYEELIRRIARLGIKADVQVPLEQIGIDIDSKTMLDNLSEILALAQRYNVFVWAELMNKEQALKELEDVGVKGIAMHDDSAIDCIKVYRRMKRVKIMFKEGEKDENIHYKDLLESLPRSRFGECVLSSLPEETFLAAARRSRNERNLTFEFRLGYRGRKIRKALGKGSTMSVLVPFGKDWVRYAMNNVPEGYMRFIAGRLMSDEESGV